MQVNNGPEDTKVGRVVTKDFRGLMHEADFKDTNKYICPRTGAHFKWLDLCRVLDPIRVKRGDKQCVQFAETQSFDNFSISSGRFDEI